MKQLPRKAITWHLSTWIAPAILVTSSSLFSTNSAYAGMQFRCEDYTSSSGYKIPPTRHDSLVCTNGKIKKVTGPNRQQNWCECSQGQKIVKNQAPSPSTSKPSPTPSSSSAASPKTGAGANAALGSASTAAQAAKGIGSKSDATAAAGTGKSTTLGKTSSSGNPPASDTAAKTPSGKEINPLTPKSTTLDATASSSGAGGTSQSSTPSGPNAGKEINPLTPKTTTLDATASGSSAGGTSQSSTPSGPNAGKEITPLTPKTTTLDATASSSGAGGTSQSSTPSGPNAGKEITPLTPKTTTLDATASSSGAGGTSSLTSTNSSAGAASTTGTTTGTSTGAPARNDRIIGLHGREQSQGVAPAPKMPDYSGLAKEKNYLQNSGGNTQTGAASGTTTHAATGNQSGSAATNQNGNQNGSASGTTTHAAAGNQSGSAATNQNGNQNSATNDHQAGSNGGSTVATSIDKKDVTPTPTAKPTVTYERKREMRDDLSEVKFKKGNDDDCATSAGIDGAYGCRGTRTTMSIANVTNTGSQMAAGFATQLQGQQAQQTALERGTQSAVMDSAGEMQKNTGRAQQSIGTLNAVMGVLQLSKASKHKNISSKLSNEDNRGVVADDEGKVKGTGKDSELILTKNNFDGAVQLRLIDPITNKPIQSEIDMKRRLIADKVGQVMDSASGEQKAMRSQANAAGMMSMLTAAQMLTSGYFNVKNGKAMKANAKKLGSLENRGGMIPGFDGSPVQNAAAPRQATGITGSGEKELLEATTDDTPIADSGSLGNPFNEGGRQNGLTGPGMTPGAFERGGGSPAAGGGGGGGMAGGSTSPASGGSDAEPSAKYAEQNKTGGTYDGGGGGSMTRGGSSGGGKADNGPDLSGLLAQFLPKAEEEGQKHTSILEYGSRGPASEEAPNSLLDKNANLFERIHETYQDKNGKGYVGI